MHQQKRDWHAHIFTALTLFCLHSALNCGADIGPYGWCTTFKMPPLSPLLTAASPTSFSHNPLPLSLRAVPCLKRDTDREAGALHLKCTSLSPLLTKALTLVRMRSALPEA